jgi:hypothetical protein
VACPQSQAFTECLNLFKLQSPTLLSIDFQYFWTVIFPVASLAKCA